MEHDDRRITLISSSPFAPRRPWLTSRTAPCRLMFVESFDAISFALTQGAQRSRIEDVIIDGTATGAEYLHFLCTLPAAHAGDVLLILNDSAFLSSTHGGVDRALYALRPEDAQLYLETKMFAEPADAAAAA